VLRFHFFLDLPAGSASSLSLPVPRGYDTYLRAFFTRPPAITLKKGISLFFEVPLPPFPRLCLLRFFSIQLWVYFSSLVSVLSSRLSGSPPLRGPLLIFSNPHLPFWLATIVDLTFLFSMVHSFQTPLLLWPSFLSSANLDRAISFFFSYGSISGEIPRSPPQLAMVTYF